MPGPPKKKAKLSNVTIQKLPEALLAKIFSYLPVKDRFQLPTVCKQWLSVSRIPWTDISHLNASAAPNEKISTILDLCPKIRDFVAYDRTLQVDDPKLRLGPHLRSLRLYNVEFNFKRMRSSTGDNARFTVLVEEFFEGLVNLEELIWQYVYMQNKLPGQRGYSEDFSQVREIEIPALSTMVATLRRLKIVNDIGFLVRSADMMSSLRRMTNLECLHLEGIIKPGPDPKMKASVAEGYFWAGLAGLTNLRELCIADLGLVHMYGGTIAFNALAGFVCEKLPRLEVLIYADDSGIEPEGIAQLVTSHPSLRILVIAGDQYKDQGDPVAPFVVPPRKMRPRSTPGSRSTILQVFVGGGIIHDVLFTLPEANTTKFWVIDCEMPLFLAKPEVAEVFDGVWLAKMIREAGEIGQGDWVWGGRWESEYFFSFAPRAGLRSRQSFEYFSIYINFKPIVIPEFKKRKGYSCSQVCLMTAD